MRALLVSNTINAEVPSGNVMALPATGPFQFQVSWTGQDETDGVTKRRSDA